jgi:hypothetical protein
MQRLLPQTISICNDCPFFHLIGESDKSYSVACSKRLFIKSKFEPKWIPKNKIGNPITPSKDCPLRIQLEEIDHIKKYKPDNFAVVDHPSLEDTFKFMDKEFPKKKPKKAK